MGVTLSVTKMNGFPLGDSSAGFLNSNAFIGDPAFDLGSLILSPEISAPNGDPLMAPFSSDLPPAPPDVFGFGAFDRVFITQEELVFTLGLL